MRQSDYGKIKAVAQWAVQDCDPILIRFFAEWSQAFKNFICFRPEFVPNIRDDNRNYAPTHHKFG